MKKNRRDQIRRATSDYFIVYDRQSGVLIGRIGDLSRTGMKLVTPEPIGERIVLECRLVFPRIIKGVAELELDTTCMWCRENEEVGWYESGHAFNKLSDETRQIVETLVKELLAGSGGTEGEIEAPTIKLVK